MRHLSLPAALCLLLASPRASAEPYRFVKGPYLQGLDARSASVRWEGSEAVGGVVVVKGPDGKPREFKTEERSAFHALEVNGLEASTPYTYAIRVGDVTSVEGRFTTAPADNRPFSFILYGDNRSDDASHAAVVKAMLATPTDFLVHTGDMVGDGDREGDWATFFSIEAPLLRDRCVFACVGNHEMLGNNANQYLRYFQSGKAPGGERTLFFTVRWSNTRFFLLNAFASWSSGPDRAWLEQELGRADSEPGLDHRIVVMHHGPYSSGPHGGNKDLAQAGVTRLLRDHKITMLFAGHDHLYERGEMDGIKYVISGGGGAPLYNQMRRPPNKATHVHEAVHHFVEAKVDGKSLKLAARRVDGSIMESCEGGGAGWDCSGTLKDRRAPPAPSAPPVAPAVEPKKRACDCSAPGKAPPAAPLAALLALVGCLRRLPRTRKLP